MIPDTLAIVSQFSLIMSVTRSAKRSRDKSGSKNKFRNARVKKVKFNVDDEIPSDSDEEIDQEVHHEEEDLEDFDMEETAQEKKLRLTKKYLEELKNLKEVIIQFHK